MYIFEDFYTKFWRDVMGKDGFFLFGKDFKLLKLVLYSNLFKRLVSFVFLF